jgi:streptogramin lyase
MSGRRNLGDELKRVGDDFVRSNPADLAGVRAAVDRKRHRRQIVTGGGVLAAAAVSALLFFSLSGPSGTTPDIKPAESPEASAPDELRVTKEIALGVIPGQVASSEGVAYITSSDSGKVLIVDLEEGAVVTERALGAPEDIIRDGASGSLWVTDPTLGSIHRLSARSLKNTDPSFPLENGAAPVRLTVTGNNLRVAGDEGGVVRIDLATSEQFSLTGEDVIDIAATGGRNLWILTATGEIRAIDSMTGADVGLPVVDVEPREASEITFAKEAIWYGAQGNSVMTRIDNVTGAQASVQLPAGYWDLDADRSGLWVLMRSSAEAGVLAAIDPDTGAATQRSLRIEGQPVDIATSGDGIWVVKAGTQSVIHVNDQSPGEL